MKALVVEDDLKSQCLLAKVLAERGHEVTTFENAEQAILEYQKEFYPLLFVGVELPGMNGLQYCRWIRSQDRGEGTYVIAAVDPNVPNEVQQVLEAGANDFLTKPYQLDQLRARLTIGERQMAQFFEQQQLEENLKSETHRWTLMEAALIKAQRDHEIALAAKEAELAQLREELRALSADREHGASVEEAFAKQNQDLTQLRKEISGLWNRCGESERALEASRAECESGKARVRETEKALELAVGEANRLRQVGGEFTSSMRESLRSKDEELARLRTELTEVREELANRVRRHTEELIRLSEQMLLNIEDRKKVESELEQRLAAEVEEAARLRSMLALSNQHAATLEQKHQVTVEELRVHRDARKRLESRWQILVRLGSQLNHARTTEDVARVAGRSTHDLVGWDMFSLDGYLAAGDWVHSVLSLECVDGEIRAARPLQTESRPTSLMRRVLEDGPQIILQPGSAVLSSGPVVVDNRRRRSISLLCVPLLSGSGAIGFVSVRSGGENAYSVEDLEMLEMVASHCAGALERIELVSEHAAHGEAADRPQPAVAVSAGH